MGRYTVLGSGGVCKTLGKRLIWFESRAAHQLVCYMARYLARLGATQVKNKVSKMVCGSQKKTASRAEVLVGLCPYIALEGNGKDKA